MLLLGVLLLELRGRVLVMIICVWRREMIKLRLGLGCVE